MPSLLEQSNGKWRALLSTILELDAETLDGKHHPCPACGGDDRFRFDDQDGRGTYFCAGCGAGAGLALICKTKNISPNEAWKLVKEALPTAKVGAPATKKDHRPLIKRILAPALPIAPGDSVYAYLQSRGILSPPRSILRSPTLFPDETDPEMMVARVQLGSKLVGVHLTLLKNGQRAYRLMYGLSEGSLKGGAIHLHSLGPKGELLIGEGIETSLSASQHFYRPAWSCMTGVLLEQVDLPPTVTDLLVAGDNDNNYTGQKFAYARANRSVVIEHRKTRVEIPPEVDTDWNSVAKQPLV